MTTTTRPRLTVIEPQQANPYATRCPMCGVRALFRHTKEGPDMHHYYEQHCCHRSELVSNDLGALWHATCDYHSAWALRERAS